MYTIINIGRKRNTLAGILFFVISLVVSILTMSPPVSALSTVRIHAGGRAVTNSSGHTFSADKYYDGGWAYETSYGIKGTSTSKLYNTERAGMKGYNIPVENGTYTVYLRFAEIWYTKPGQRVMKVTAEGQTLLDNYDIVAKVGPKVAVKEEFTVAVRDGVLNLGFSARVDAPKIAAIEVVPSSNQSPTPTPTPTPTPDPTPTNPTPSDDTTPPTVPGSVIAAPQSPVEIKISWAASADNKGVAGYRVYRGADQVATITNGLTYTDKGLSPATAYTYAVRAYDAAGNVSALSTPITVKTLAVTSTSSVNDTAIGSGMNQFSFSSRWYTDTNAMSAHLGDNHFTNVKDQWYQLKFYGTQVKVYAEKNDAIGRYAFSIDGGAETKVDGYSSSRQDQQLLYTSPVLPLGEHTVKVRNTGEKNAASRGTYIVGDRIDVTTSTPGSTSPDGDKESPKVTITSPVYGQTVKDAVGLAVNAQDNVGVTKVDYYLDGSPLNISTTSPFTASWNTAKVNNGKHTLTAKAYDAAGNTATSSAVEVNVDNAIVTCNKMTVPTTFGKSVQTISVPTSGTYRIWSRVSAPTAADNSFYLSIDDNGCVYNVGDDAPPVDQWSWINYQNGNFSQPVDVVLSAGMHTVTLTGREQNVRVDRVIATNDLTCVPSGKGDNCANPTVYQDTVAPSAPTALKDTKVEAQKVALSWSGSTDNVGVTNYNIIRNGYVVATVNKDTLSYEDATVAPGTGYSYVITARDAAGNESQPSNTLSLTTPKVATTDTQAPTAPANLKAVGVSSKQINLTWGASTDNIGVVSYKVFRGASEIATVVGTSYGDSNNLSAGTSYSYTVKALDAAGNVSPASAAASALTLTEGASDPVIGIVSDILYTKDGKNTYIKTAEFMKKQTDLAAIIMPGDLNNVNGTQSEWENMWEPTWGQLDSLARPSPGNHDYYTSGAWPYYDHWKPYGYYNSNKWYSYDIGAWHLISLNSEVAHDSGSAQVAWLKDDLAKNKKKCTLAYAHVPRFSGGSMHGNDSTMQPIYQALYDANADVFFAGHDHHYERYAGMTPSGSVDNQRGIVSFVTGIGGAAPRSASPRTGTQKIVTDKYGVIKLTLHADSYDFKYVDINNTIQDSGTGTCH